jgi:hypothetical protein
MDSFRRRRSRSLPPAWLRPREFLLLLLLLVAEPLDVVFGTRGDPYLVVDRFAAGEDRRRRPVTFDPWAFGGAFVFSSRAGASLVLLQGHPVCYVALVPGPRRIYRVSQRVDRATYPRDLPVCLSVCLCVGTLFSMGSRPNNDQPMTILFKITSLWVPLSSFFV